MEEGARATETQARGGEVSKGSWLCVAGGVQGPEGQSQRRWNEPALWGSGDWRVGSEGFSIQRKKEEGPAERRADAEGVESWWGMAWGGRCF